MRELTTASEVRAHAIVVQRRIARQRVLPRIVPPEPPPPEPVVVVLETPPSPQTIVRMYLDIVGDWCGVPVEQYRAFRRQERVVWARHVACYVLKELTQLSYPSIGRAIGGFDHSTVIHAVRKVTKLRERNESINAEVAAILEECKRAVAERTQLAS